MKGSRALKRDACGSAGRVVWDEFLRRETRTVSVLMRRIHSRRRRCKFRGEQHSLRSEMTRNAG